MSARREQLLEELVRECESAGGRALAVPADVSNRADVEQLSKAAISQFGRVDVWVNNTGTGALGRFEEVPLEEHEQVIGDGPAGRLYGSYFAMRQFRQQGSGTLINIASVIGKVPSPYFAFYAAAKHGVKYVNITDISGTDTFWVGFHDITAPNATFTSYNSYFAVGLSAADGDTKTAAEDDGGGTTTTDIDSGSSDAVLTDTSGFVKWCVKVSDTGAATPTVNGVTPSNAAGYTFDAGTPVVPFIHFLHDVDVTDEIILTEWEVSYQ